MPEMIDECPPEIPEDVITTICGVCGIGIYTSEIAGEVIGGTLINYQDRHQPVQIGFALCKEHFDLIWKNCSDPNAVEKGTIRRAALTEMDEHDLAQYEWEKANGKRPKKEKDTDVQ